MVTINGITNFVPSSGDTNIFVSYLKLEKNRKENFSY